MIISNNNKHLYNTQKFDSYYNIYTVIVNHSKKQEIDYTLQNESSNICVDYHKREQLLDCYFIIEKVINELNINSLYKIVYGHFYNNSDMFIYKNVNYDKIINYKINRCNHNALLYNDHNDLVYDNSTYNIQRQLDLIANEQSDIWKQYYGSYNKPLEILYYEDNEHIIIEATTEDYATVIYNKDNELLSITSINILKK